MKNLNSDPSTPNAETTRADKKIIPISRTSLNPQEALVSSLFKQYEIINQFIANKYGVMRLAARICDLKSKGAVISDYKKDITVDGVKHPRVAFYTLMGWE